MDPMFLWQTLWPGGGEGGGEGHSFIMITIIIIFITIIIIISIIMIIIIIIISKLFSLSFLNRQHSRWPIIGAGGGRRQLPRAHGGWHFCAARRRASGLLRPKQAAG